MVAALADSEPKVFWLDSPDAPEPAPALEGDQRCGLAIVGGGFTGLWAALLAAQAGEDVVLLEGDRCGWGASGRNGGFLEASLTHGLANGLSRWPGEIERLIELGRENFAAIRDTLERRDIDAAWDESGLIEVATRPHEVAWIEEAAATAAAYGEDVVLLDREAMRAEVDSPTYLAGVWQRGSSATVDPARLAWGLRRAATEDGVRLHERTPVRRLAPDGDGVVLETDGGRLRADRAVLATNAYRPLVRSIRHFVLPVYDYVLVTEPLSPEPSSRRWAGAGARASPTPATAFTTTASRPTTGCCGAATRRSTTSATAWTRAWRSTRAPSGSWPRTSRPLSRSSRASASPTAGPGRSTPARVSA